jgi:hypothetical protein
MRKTIIASAVAVAALTVGSEAMAAQFGLHNGEVLSSGDMVYGEFGFPDIGIGFQHSISSKFDLGFRLGINYGEEYRPDAIQMGMSMAVPLRLQLFESGKVAGKLVFAPGFRFDQFNYPMFFGLQFPVGLEMGIKATPDFTISFGADMPFYVNFTHGAFLGIPVLFGFGFEYMVDPHIAIGANTRFGPSIVSDRNDAGYHQDGSTDFGLIAQGYFAYRL